MLIALRGVPNKVQVADMGIDGRIFPVGTRPDDQNNMFAGDWFPVQVKQTDKVGRPDIDAFEAVMHREDRQRGSLSPSDSPAMPRPSALRSSRRPSA